MIQVKDGHDGLAALPFCHAERCQGTRLVEPEMIRTKELHGH
jgi:hypothetical protein